MDFPGAQARGVAIHQAHSSLELDEDVVRATIDRAVSGEDFSIRDLSVVLTNHRSVHEVNRDWLGHDFETDVVSFLLDENAVTTKIVDGEIYVDLDTAAERALEFDTTFEQEALRYVVHGLLHLMGYNDATDDQRASMRALEDKYLAG